MEGTISLFWNWKVAVYLFVAGVSAGAFAVSAFATILDEQRYEDIARSGALIAPFPLVLGLVCLIFDLERPLLFWKLLTTVQPYSIMSLGSWLLVVFSLLSGLYFILWLPDNFPVPGVRALSARGRAGGADIRRSYLAEIRGRRDRHTLRVWIGLIGIPLSLLVAIYTGVLLGVLSARPFWSNPVLPFLFLVSALKTGTASVCLIVCFVKGFGGGVHEEMEAKKRMIHAVDSVLMVLAIIAVSLFVFGFYTSSNSAAEAGNLIMGGIYTLPFWGVVVGVGIIVPLCLEVYEVFPRVVGQGTPREHNPWLSGAATMAVLLGSFALRYVVVYAGQTQLPILS